MKLFPLCWKALHNKTSSSDKVGAGFGFGSDGDEAHTSSGDNLSLPKLNAVKIVGTSKFFWRRFMTQNKVLLDLILILMFLHPAKEIIFASWIFLVEVVVMGRKVPMGLHLQKSQTSGFGLLTLIHVEQIRASLKYQQ